MVWSTLKQPYRGRRTFSLKIMEKKSGSLILKFAFCLLSTGLFSAYFFYLFLIPQTPARVARPSASLVSDFPLWSWIVSLPFPVPNDSKSVGILLIAVTLLAFAVYGLAIILSKSLQAYPGSMAFVLVPASAYLIMSTLALPNLNTDIFNYMLRGRLSAVYGENPYITAADEIPFDPVYPYASHAYTEDAEWWKLPLWTSIEVGLAELTGQDIAKNLLIYRAAFLLVNILNLVFIVKILKEIHPHYLLTGLVVFAWNPIIIMFGQSKGDTFIVFFLLLAILLFVLERKNLAIIPLTLSVLIKLTTLPFAAVYFLAYLKQKRWKEYLILGILFAVIAGFFYIHFGLGEFLTTQLFSIIGMSGSSQPDYLRSFLRVIFVGLIFTIGITRSGEQKQMVWGWLLLALYFSLFLVSYGKAWYLIPLIALASLIPDWRSISLTSVISLTGFLIYAWDTTFSSEYAAPFMISFPRYLIYLTLPILVLIAIGSLLLRKKIQGNWHHRAEVTTHSLSQEEP